MMTPASGSETIRQLGVPDNLSSTNARANDSLFGDEPDPEVEPEQVLVRQDALVKKSTWKWPQFLHKLSLHGLFKDSQSSFVSEPDKDAIHGHEDVSLAPGMLRLPVEIRNQIYGHLFDKRLVIIRRHDDLPYRDGSPLLDAITEHREPERPKATRSIRIVMSSIKKTTRDVCRKVIHRGLSYDRIPGRKPLPIEGVNWETSLNSLLLTCRTIYHETAPILYGNTVFYFDDAQRLRSFLKTVSNRNLACITNLHVHVRTYGIPNDAENNLWEQKHIKCWTKIFATIAKKMTNLRVLRVALTVRCVTDALKYAFRPTRHNTDWKGRASYMLMLRDLSDLTKLEDFTVSIRATDDFTQQYDHMSANMLYASFALANIYPLDWLEAKVKALHRSFFERMHDGLEKAMFDVARGKDPDESFVAVAAATTEYITYCMDPIGDMLVRDRESEVQRTTYGTLRECRREDQET